MSVINVIKNNPAFGWSSQGTHQLITQKAFFDLEKSKPEYKKRLNFKNKWLIIENANNPDYDEKWPSVKKASTLPGSHFHRLISYVLMALKPSRANRETNLKHYYNPVTKESYIPSYKETAKSTFMRHARNAVLFKRVGFSDKAYSEIGRACHYLQDMSQPYHVSAKGTLDAALKRARHLKFEEKILNSQKNYSFPIKKIEPQAKYAEKDLKTFLSDLFEKTAKTAYRASLNPDFEQFRMSEKLLNLGKNSTSKLLARFLQETDILE